MIDPCVSFGYLSCDGRSIGYRVYATEASGRRRVSAVIADWPLVAALLASEADRVGLGGLYRGAPDRLA